MLVIINYDCLEMMGWWSISITFPKVMKGKYSVSIFQSDWPTVTDCIAFIDGIPTKYIYRGIVTGGDGLLQKIGNVNFTTTEEHTITLTNISYGNLFWDYVRFDPE